MSKFTSEMMDSLADKLLIGLTKEENELVLKEMNIIEQNMELISNFPNIENVEVMSHALDDFTYELRSDEAKESVDIDLLLQNCDRYVDREIEVPKVVD